MFLLLDSQHMQHRVQMEPQLPRARMVNSRSSEQQQVHMLRMSFSILLKLEHLLT
jgi:hypothetical protein